MKTFATILPILPVLLIAASCTRSNNRVTMKEDATSTTIYSGERPLLCYVHAVTPAPEGQDPLFQRSAYIHPVWSPGGEVLTRIQPPDHLHHYGIWNPWTRTHFDDRSVDFWNLGEGQGTVRFVEYLDRKEKKGAAGFTARHAHIYFREDGTEGVAMNETWDVKVHQVTEKSYLIDLVTTLSTPLEEGITLEAYRYGGGLGYRATVNWNTDNSTVLTSEGKTRADADGTEARWVIVEGESLVPEGRSGILFLSHPGNRAHPEPMRVWPPDQYEGLSNVFFEFCPIRHQQWKLEPGKEYVLKYRMVVFDGKMEVPAAEDYWSRFAAG
jgi:hypothetical protein